MNYYVYIIKSLIKKYYYVGMTSNIGRRIDQHNKRQVRSTKAFVPFKLIYKKEFSRRKEARDYEKFLKIRCNKEKILASL